MESSQPEETNKIPQLNEGPLTSSAAFILARLGLSESATLSGAPLSTLLAALQDDRWERRASAATALGKVGKSAPIEPLVTALQDTREEVRAAVARTLGQIRDVPVAPLEKALQDPSALVREAAATALGKVGAVTAIEPLAVALQDTHEEVRAAATQALGRISKAVSISLLESALQDQSSLVREAAAEALGQIGNSAARLLLLRHMNDEDAIVRDIIAQSLMTLESSLESSTFQQFIQLLLQNHEPSLQQIIEAITRVLRNLGFNIHEETACIAPLVVALQGTDNSIKKPIVYYIIGRAFDALNEYTPLAPLIEALLENQHNPVILAEIWRTLYLMAQESLKKRNLLHTLLKATSNDDRQMQEEINTAIEWLIKLASALVEERSSTEQIQKTLQEEENTKHKKMRNYLIHQALQALDEREEIDSLLTQLNSSDVEVKLAAAQELTKRAKKALMGRLPSGPLIITLKHASGGTPVELQFGIYPEGRTEGKTKEGRQIFPWHGVLPPKLQLPSLYHLLGEAFNSSG
jgi:HEAT repeat protein